MLLGIKWYQFVPNDDVRRLTKQPKFTAIIQSRWLTLFGHIMRMDDNADTKRILLASPPADSRRQLGLPASHGSEPSSVEDNVDVWRYAILELHARNDDDDDVCCIHILCMISVVTFSQSLRFVAVVQYLGY